MCYETKEFWNHCIREPLQKFLVWAFFSATECSDGFFGHFSVIDRNVFEMTEKIKLFRSEYLKI